MYDQKSFKTKFNVRQKYCKRKTSDIVNERDSTYFAYLIVKNGTYWLIGRVHPSVHAWLNIFKWKYFVT